MPNILGFRQDTGSRKVHSANVSPKFVGSQKLSKIVGFSKHCGSVSIVVQGCRKQHEAVGQPFIEGTS